MSNHKDIQQLRTFQRMSGVRLRRARQLWVYLIFEDCWNGGNAAIISAAKRAKERGLYAPSTDLRSVSFSICRHMYRLFRLANPQLKAYSDSAGFGWHNFTRDFQHIDWSVTHTRKRWRSL